MVGESEMLARFILQGSYVRSDNTIRQNAFIPHPYPDLSVTRHLNWNEAQIWENGEAVARTSKKNLHGRGDCLCSVYRFFKLKVLAAPVQGNPNHANVTDWPADKPAQKIIALQIASHASYFPKLSK